MRGSRGKLTTSSVSNESIVMAISSNRCEGRAPNIKKSSSLALLSVDLVAAAALAPSSPVDLDDEAIGLVASIVGSAGVDGVGW